MNERILRFIVKTSDPQMDVFERFQQQGRPALNSTVWRGKEPRTCCVTRVNGYGGASPNHPASLNVEVRYRPPGFVTFIGKTKYVGWTLMMLDATSDGVLLDGHGQPLKDGDPPVFLPFEVYPEADFNKIDFGEFVGEEDARSVKNWTYESFQKFSNEETLKAGRFSSTVHSTFIASHRRRPMAKIMIVAGDTMQVTTDGFHTRVLFLGKGVKHFQHVLYVKLTELMTEFMEGKVSLVTHSVGDDGIFVSMTHSLLDASQVHEGVGTKFDVLNDMVPASFMNDLALQMSDEFLIEADVVIGQQSGLYLRHQKPTHD